MFRDSPEWDTGYRGGRRWVQRREESACVRRDKNLVLASISISLVLVSDCQAQVNARKKQNKY